MIATNFYTRFGIALTDTPLAADTRLVSIATNTFVLSGRRSGVTGFLERRCFACLVIDLTITVVVEPITGFLCAVRSRLNTSALLISFGVFANARILREVLTGTPFIGCPIAVVVELVRTDLGGLVRCRWLAGALVVELAVNADSFAQPFVIANTPFIHSAIAVVVELIAAIFRGAVCQRRLTLTLSINGSIDANAFAQSIVVTCTTLVHNAITVVVELIAAVF